MSQETRAYLRSLVEQVEGTVARLDHLQTEQAETQQRLDSVLVAQYQERRAALQPAAEQAWAEVFQPWWQAHEVAGTWKALASVLGVTGSASLAEKVLYFYPAQALATVGAEKGIPNLAGSNWEATLQLHVQGKSVQPIVHRYAQGGPTSMAGGYLSAQLRVPVDVRRSLAAQPDLEPDLILAWADQIQSGSLDEVLVELFEQMTR